MRLIAEFSVGDGCTFSATKTQPIVYESAEKFLFDLELLAQEKFALDFKNEERHKTINLGGIEIELWELYDENFLNLPYVYTIDEYFEKVENKCAE